jgi:hypothetical protein
MIVTRAFVLYGYTYQNSLNHRKKTLKTLRIHPFITNALYRNIEENLTITKKHILHFKKGTLHGFKNKRNEQ